MARPTVAEINLEAFVHNWKFLQTIRAAEHMIPVIKANAYGHGAKILSQTLQQHGAQRVAVALFEEACEVREAGFRGEILILGPFAKDDIPLAQEKKLTPVVGDREFFLQLASASFSGPLHIKWDTGMHRLGLSPSDGPWVQSLLQKHPFLKVKAFCTHFLKGEDFGLPNGYSAQQVKSFLEICSQFPAGLEKHIFNSDGLLAEGHYHLGPPEWGARPGLCLYGFAGVKNALAAQLRPVMTLKTKVVHLLEVPEGESVSYNAKWTAGRRSKIAVLPIGYADGYPRSLSNKGQVFIRHQCVPVVGIVCMDYIMIDVTDVPQVAIADDVELWGENISLYSVAEAAETIPYELMTALTARVPRRVQSS